MQIIIYQKMMYNMSFKVIISASNILYKYIPVKKLILNI